MPGKKNGPHDFGFGDQALGGVDGSRFGAADYGEGFRDEFLAVVCVLDLLVGQEINPPPPS